MKMNRFLLYLCVIAFSHSLMAESVKPTKAVQSITSEVFQPPAEEAIPDNEFGDMVRFGKKVFTETGIHAGKYVGNGMKCVNCHLDAGRLANSAPLWAALGQISRLQR